MSQLASDWFQLGKTGSFMLFRDFRETSWAGKPLVWPVKKLCSVWHLSTRYALCYSDEIAAVMRKKYLNNPDFTYEKVNRASVACGPMVKWAIAQVCTVTLPPDSHGLALSRLHIAPLK